MADLSNMAQDALRADILAVGVDDFVSMADVKGIVDNDGLAASPADVQRLTVDTIRSLLVDGLVEVGVLASSDSRDFGRWPGTVDEVMTRFNDRFTALYEDRHEWAYKIWLNLTAKCRQVSNARGGDGPE
ncbi:hypothetical protein [Mycobacterium paraterrae]|uniref:Uncharacterized protein n=1 Tax=Mycobacterium paraterrae TaxID=577492 RepID=A0ABY3VJF8_9MYCO|nr:hypothetical protein [Mycobacterium paraterrae]UMB68771.1 hypothetical protein MKK62_20560 [Mycobacterium paraterrae]